MAGENKNGIAAEAKPCASVPGCSEPVRLSHIEIEGFSLARVIPKSSVEPQSRAGVSSKPTLGVEFGNSTTPHPLVATLLSGKCDMRFDLTLFKAI
jgi:hypothetical protein